MHRDDPADMSIDERLDELASMLSAAGLPITLPLAVCHQRMIHPTSRTRDPRFHAPVDEAAYVDRSKAVASESKR